MSKTKTEKMTERVTVKMDAALKAKLQREAAWCGGDMSAYIRSLLENRLSQAAGTCYIYRWRRRYDGTLESLRDQSRRPHHHPNQHSEEELKLIRDMRRRNPDAGLVVFWVKLRQRGYTRTVTGLYRVLRKLGW